MDFSSGHSRAEGIRRTLCLAYQSLGIVYGDLSTSPIYVYKSTFSGKLRLYEEDHEILGVLSLVFWTLTLVPLCKYVLFVLSADDNGEGGTFALYSLLCRHAKMGLLPASLSGDHQVSSYEYGASGNETNTSFAMREFFEKHQHSRVVLLLAVLFGTGMVIGDGILTPSMSVLSAVSGIKVKVPQLHENHTVAIACIVLVALFWLQHYGTRKVGFLFAPILVLWLFCISSVGLYNIVHWNPRVIYAVSPHYIYTFFRETGKVGWRSLGGIVLCITGAEAMFADLGHFSQLSVRMAFAGFVYPCLVLAYMGEAAYLSKHRQDLQSSFFKSIPEGVFWPVFIIATLATAVASQAIISATFSIVSQCRALKCFPRVKIIHTSNCIHGQIYIPEVNWILMILSLAVVLGFRDTDKIGNAYGLAVITVMFVTTCLMFLIITTVWRRHVLLASAFVIIFGSIELFYLSSCVTKVHEGGWFPVISSLVILSLMSIWKYGTIKKYDYEYQNKVSVDSLLALSPSLGIIRVPGIGLIYSDIVNGVPPMFAHFVTNFPAFHQIVIFVTLETLMVPKVMDSERFLITRIESPELYVFRCSVRYGYKDLMDTYNFESQLLEKMAGFLESGSSSDGKMTLKGDQRMQQVTRSEVTTSVGQRQRRRVKFRDVEANDEIERLNEAREAGVAYMIGNTCVIANEASCFIKKFAINIIYRFLKQNCRRPAVALGIPHTSLIEVGTVYFV